MSNKTPCYICDAPVEFAEETRCPLHKKNYGYTFKDGGVVTDLLDGKIVHCADHVSKSELRAWCEDRIGERSKEYDYSQGAYDVYYVILKRFCKGEL